MAGQAPTQDVPPKHRLERAGLKNSTGALIMAAQEQALTPRAIEAQIYHQTRLKVSVLQRGF